MTEEVQNGRRVHVTWPDYDGEIGYQPHGSVIQCSYVPVRGAPAPRVGEQRGIPTVGNFEVLRVSRNPYIPDMRTLDLKNLV